MVGDSPLTNEIGWDYYKNLTVKDFLTMNKVQPPQVVAHAMS